VCGSGGGWTSGRELWSSGGDRDTGKTCDVPARSRRPLSANDRLDAAKGSRTVRRGRKKTWTVIDRGGQAHDRSRNPDGVSQSYGQSWTECCRSGCVDAFIRSSIRKVAVGRRALYAGRRRSRGGDQKIPIADSVSAHQGCRE